MLRTSLFLAAGLLAAACQPATSDPVSIPGTVAATATTTIDQTTTTSHPTTTTTPAPTPTTIPTHPARDPAPPIGDRVQPRVVRGAAVIAAGGAPLAREPDDEPYVIAHEGIVFPVTDRRGAWLQLLDHCNDPGWVPYEYVAFTPARSGGLAPGEGLRFSDAVFVIDPGHGGPNIGAVGPAGLLEKEVNLDIARRLRDLLHASHTINWETREVLLGSDIPPARQVWVTRQEGPPGADIEAGLTFRTTLADSLRAHALVSIHNNAAPDGPSDGPGSEVYHGIDDPPSKRLSGLIVEEMRSEFGRFEADWVSDDDAGAKSRIRENGVDVYGIIRESEVPAVIAEGVYLSNESEEALLNTPEFRQAYADAVYRALVRFVTTTDPGSGFIETEPFTGRLSSGAPVPECTVPAQPEP